MVKVTFALAVETLVARTQEEQEMAVKNLSLTIEDRKGMIIGTPKECIDRIREYVESGVTHLSIGIKPVENFFEGLKLYSEEIIPNI